MGKKEYGIDLEYEAFVADVRPTFSSEPKLDESGLLTDEVIFDIGKRFYKNFVNRRKIA